MREIVALPIGDCNRGSSVRQDDYKALPKLLMVSLSNHVRLEPASFDKLRMSGR